MCTPLQRGHTVTERMTRVECAGSKDPMDSSDQSHGEEPAELRAAQNSRRHSTTKRRAAFRNRGSSLGRHPRELRGSRERCKVSAASRFPETPTISLGVLQPWPCPHQGSFRRKQAAVIACPSDAAPLAALLQQVREEYGRMPGLKLTKPQAMHLFGVAPSVCAAMFRALVMEDFLSRAGNGVFVRSIRDSRNQPRRQPSDAAIA
jgi:hypothetical protein